MAFLGTFSYAVKMQDDALIQGNNSEFDFRASGAYIFRPLKQEPNIFSDAGGNATVFKGPLVTEIQQIISGYVSQVSRLYAGQQEIENEWLVGPIPTNDGKGISASRGLLG